MTQEPQEKWQIALSKWDKWNASINNVRAHIQSKYGDVAQLLTNAKFSVKVRGEDNHPIFDIAMNDAEETIWDIVDELRSLSDEFIMGNLL
jgi:hypothetical protein